jgi:glutathione S-transferase
MKLYESRTCWKCVEVRSVLDELGLAHETVETRGNPEAKRLMLQAQGDPVRVPMLVDGDLAIWDWRRIVAYLRQTYGGESADQPWQEMPAFKGGSCTLGERCDSAPDGQTAEQRA